MRIGVPREIKNHPFRVGLTPAGVRALAAEARLRYGLPEHAGQVTHRDLARDVSRPHTPATGVLA